MLFQTINAVFARGYSVQNSLLVMKEKGQKIVQPFIVLIDGSSIESNRKEITTFWKTTERYFELDDYVNNLCKEANGKRP